MTDHTASEIPCPVTLVLGGARSGKSAFAERLLERSPNPIYLATAEPRDDEMAARIRQHKARRGERWQLVEEAMDLAGALTRVSSPGSVVLVDCLTLWVSNLMHASRDITAETENLVRSLEALPGSVVLVSNEVGLGIVPDNPMAREFRDHAGRLHRALAAKAQRVYFIVAGIPTILKDASIS